MQILLSTHPSMWSDEVNQTLYKMVIHRVEMLLGSKYRDWAEDCAQEAFYNVIKSWESLSQTSDPEAWINKVVRNYCFDFLRHHKIIEFIALDPALDLIERGGEREDGEAAIAGFKDIQDKLLNKVRGPEDIVVSQTIIREAISKLTRSQAEAVILIHVYGFSYQEAAVAMVPARNVSTVKSDVRRGLQKLKELLKED